MLQDTTTTFLDSLTQALEQSSGGGAQSLLDIIGLAGGFQWPILIVFVIGLAALMNTLVRTFLDSKQSSYLRSLSLEETEANDFKTLSESDDQSVYHALLRKILRRARFTNDHGDLLKTVGVAMEQQRQSLQLTNKLVTYCSSAAGGLGLAGTLVGMYSSFAAAGTDPNTVYVGISLALVSTLLGIAASIILEAAETFVSRYAAKQHTRASGWGEEVCDRLGQIKQSAFQDLGGVTVSQAI